MKIGQVVLLLTNKDQKVIPGLVKQEIITRSVAGEVVSYVLEVGPKGKSKEVNSSKIDGMVFLSSEELKEFMISQMETFIDQTIQTASKLANDWYSTEPVAPDHSAMIEELVASTPTTQMQQRQPKKPTFQSIEEEKRAKIQAIVEEANNGI